MTVPSVYAKVASMECTYKYIKVWQVLRFAKTILSPTSINEMRASIRARSQCDVIHIIIANASSAPTQSWFQNHGFHLTRPERLEMPLRQFISVRFRTHPGRKPGL